jgi:D-mannonate dehydratase
MDRYQMMKALRKVKFDGAAEPDHVPHLVGREGFSSQGTAYVISYMRVVEAPNEEAG